MTSTGVVWFRRDLRLSDNPAWAIATANHDRVVALVVLEPALLAAAGPRRRDRYLAGLEALDAQLRSMGASLSVRRGPSTRAVPELAAQSNTAAVYTNADPSPFARSRDIAVETALDVPFERFHGSTIHEPGSILTNSGRVSKVFTPFYRRWAATAPKPWPEPGSAEPIKVAGVSIPPSGMKEPVGEHAAWARLHHWNDSVDDYQNTRDFITHDATSKLSADLRLGTIAARSVLEFIGTASDGRAAFVRQLAWRDWWAHTMWENAGLLDSATNSTYDHIEWIDDDEAFSAWTSGATGYPIVDAGMRELEATGWMHNRLRMICASFLVKHLLVDWRRGERHFRRLLIDGDPAQNAGNWQWVAGTGPDAAPYFRVFNPTTQSKKFDPNGEHIRRWVPELARLDSKVIHEPGSATEAQLARAGVALGVDYPRPIVEHGWARQRALAAYESARA